MSRGDDGVLGAACARRRTMLGALALTLPLVGGCYTYTPISANPAPVGSDVRLMVTRAGAPEVVTSRTEDLVPQIKGTVEGSEDGSLLVRMPLRGDRGTGTTVLDIAQLVTVPTDEILSIELQSFSPARTGFLVGGGVAAAAFIIYVIIDAGRDSNSIENPDPDLFFGRVGIPIGE